MGVVYEHDWNSNVNVQMVLQGFYVQVYESYLSSITQVRFFSVPPSPSPTHPPSNDTNSLKISIIMTIIFGIFLVLLIIAFVIFILRKKRQKTSFSIPTDKIITPPLYSISLSRSNSTVSSHIYEDLL